MDDLIFETEEHAVVADRTSKGIMNRAVRSTMRIDFRVLQEIGVLEDLDRHTQWVGFTRRFFEIPALHRPIPDLTWDFFASVCYHS